MIAIKKEIVEKLVKRFGNLIESIIYDQDDNSDTTILDLYNIDRDIILYFLHYMVALKDFDIIDDALYENIENEIYKCI